MPRCLSYLGAFRRPPSPGLRDSSYRWRDHGQDAAFTPRALTFFSRNRFRYFSRRPHDGEGSQLSRQASSGGVGGAQRETPREGRGSRAAAEEVGNTGDGDPENRQRLSSGCWESENVTAAVA